MPQRRRQAAHRRLVDEINAGDEIMTSGGLLGRVTRVGEDELGLEVAKGVEVRVAKRAVAAVLPPEGAGGFPAT
jgi:preprotein translocase subunit YajC